MARHRRTAAAVGLCLATATTSPGLAFQLHPVHGIAASGSNARGHDLGGRRSAACRHLAVRDEGHDNERRQESSEAPLPSSPRGCVSRGGRPRASKDVAALVLSGLLLGNPQLSDAAATTIPATGAHGVDTATQSRLIEDLEKKLTSLSLGSASQPNQAEPSQASPTSASEQQQAGTESSRRSPAATTTAPQTSTATAQQAAQQAAVAAAADDSARAGATPSSPSSATTETVAAGGAYTIGTLGTIGGKPMVKLQEHTFSVKLPELNLPSVGPITVPEEGGLFGAPAGRVEAVPGLPGAEAVRNVLMRAQSGEDVDTLLRSMAAMVPTQAGYHRAMTELEHRVHSNIKTVENPLFAPGVPLAAEFTSMLSHAKETAFSRARSYLPKGVEPELALFMLVTLPVLTVALRSADENSRRPMPPPLSESDTAARPPRVTKFPNSPAKVDAAAVAEARAVREAAAAEVAVELAAKEAESAAAAAEAAAAAPVAELLAEGAGVEVAAAVGAAVAAGPDSMRAELEKLQAELAAATKLAAKVEALEKANARLITQVADLSKQPELAEAGAGDTKDKEDSRAALRKEVALKQKESYRDMEEMAAKLTTAREVMSQSFPGRNSDASWEEAVPDPVDVSPAPAAEKKKPVARKKRAAPAVAEVAEKKSTGKEKVPTKKAAVKKVPVKKVAEKKAPTAKKAPAAKKAPVAKMEKEAVVGGEAAAAVAGKKPVAEKKKKTTKVAKKAPASEATKMEVEVDAGVAAPAQNGSMAPGGVEAVLAAAAAAPSRPETPDDYEDLSEDLSRALRGVQGFDLDALDLEMDDLRPEDLEELRNLEREMGDLDMASLEAEFDQEDDETVSHALRMAAESAMAHTSGGGRRIRTASPVGATSSRSPGVGGVGVGGGIGDGGEIGDGGGDGAQGSAERALRIGAGVYDGGLGGGVEGVAREYSPPQSSAAPSQAGAGSAGGLGGLEAFRKMEGRREFGGWGAGGEGGMEGVDDDWAVLTPAELKRKTVAELKGYLDEEGVGYPAKVKKAELLDIVTGFLN